ncbi:MAG: WD40/YVTN/BNR-like repeat-containing protein, partial [Bacteroidia bacterium]
MELAASFSGYAYYSDDEGDTWTPLKGEGAYCGGVWVASDNTVYTASSKSGTWNGVYVQDANDSMIAVTADVESVWNMSKENTMFEDENGNIYCVSNTHGVYKSSDGKSFTKQSGAPFNSINSQIVWYDKGSKRMFGYVEGGGGHYYSDDYGVTWTDGSSITTEGFPQHTFIKGNSKMWAYLWSTKV